MSNTPNPKPGNAEADNGSGAPVSNKTLAEWNAYKKTSAYKNSPEGKRIEKARMDAAAKKVLRSKNGWENMKKKVDKIAKASPKKSGIPASPTH